MDIAGIITGVLAAIPAITKIIELIDKWFGKTPEQKERTRIRDQVTAKKKMARKVNEAFQEARNGDTRKLNKLFNS